MAELTKGFTVYPDYWQAIEHFSLQEQKDICLAMVKYGITKEMPDPAESPVAFGMVSAWRRALDNSIENHNKAQETGNRGGRPPKKDYSELSNFRKEGKTAIECAKIYDVSVDTIYNRKEWKNAKEEKTEIASFTFQ